MRQWLYAAQRILVRSTRARLALVAGSFMAYAVFVTLIFPVQGIGAIALGAIPVGIAAWLTGLLGGMIAGTLSFPLNILLLTLIMEPGWDVMIREGAIGSVTILLAGLVIGWLRDSADRALQEVSIHKGKDERRAVELSTLLKATRAISSTVDLEEVLLIISQQLVKAVRADGCTLSRYEPEDDAIYTWIEWRREWDEEPEMPGTRYDLKDYPSTRRVLEDLGPVTIVATEPETDPAEARLLKERKSISLLMLPLALGSEVIGLVGIDTNVERRFAPAEIRLCQALADQAAIAIQKANLFQQAQTEITERKRMEKQLLHDAFHDALTELPNRALFLDRLGQSIRRAKRRREYLFAVLFLDLDRFKNVNDSLGHHTGDQLLIAVARRLEQCLRPGDTVARLGGDEFAILIEDIRSAQEATSVADRIKKELAVPFKLRHHEVFTTASIGIALSATGYERPEGLLRDADLAMYRAKSLGKARHELFSADMHTNALARLRTETDLRRAVEREEFQVHFQPVVEFETGEIVGLEALVRWAHPERGLVYPLEFIPVAEEAGLIIEIDRWVIEDACRHIVDWKQRGALAKDVALSVNLSGGQFSQHDLTQFVETALQSTGMAARHLQVEITESELMSNAEANIAVLRKLRDLEVQIQIDDFGMGYSSLSYLHRFPIDALKIPRLFVDGMEAGGEDAEIVRTILDLSRNLGMDAIAEGIEKREQLEQLRALGCRLGQGYYFSRALPPYDFEILLEKGLPWTRDLERIRVADPAGD